ncbi:MAG TPA: YceI family protein [Candidatus Limnocylindria bacterium]|nr:YceI family protein [Candidatus Limnocylindria bacterium]
MTWTIDSAHSSVTFSAKHMMVTTVRGSMKIRDFDLDFDPDNLVDSRVRVVLDAASIDTDQQMRDDHLRSADFLDVANHPDITFQSTEIVPRGGDEYEIRGDLTIRGTTRPAVLKAEYAGTVTNMQGGKSAGFSATTKINREDFGLTWNVALEQGGLLVSKDIKIEIDLEAMSSAAEVTAEAEAESEMDEREAARASA